MAVCPHCGRSIDGPTAPPSLREAFEAYNQMAERHGLPKVRAQTEGRKRKLAARLKENPRLWEEVEEELRRLNGFAREHGFVTFDWLMGPQNLAKLLEGNYRERVVTVASPPVVESAEDWRHELADWMAREFVEGGLSSVAPN